MKNGVLSKNLRKWSTLLGVLILLISVYLSFDGFDGTVNGANSEYSAVGVFIGVVFALAVTLMQFIFTSDYRGLNSTLKLIGVLSYAYSIYTNMLGAQNLLGMDSTMAWVTAAFADIVAEPMIAWGLGEALVGDLVGNLWKSVGADDEKGNSRPVNKSTYKPMHKPGSNSSSDRPSYPKKNKQLPAFHPLNARVPKEKGNEALPPWMMNHDE
jgi:hypothetical protein